MPDLRFTMGAVLATTLLVVTAFGVTATVRLAEHAKLGPLDNTRSLAYSDASDWNQFADPTASRRFEELMRPADDVTMPTSEAVAPGAPAPNAPAVLSETAAQDVTDIALAANGAETARARDNITEDRAAKPLSILPEMQSKSNEAPAPAPPALSRGRPAEPPSVAAAISPIATPGSVAPADPEISTRAVVLAAPTPSTEVKGGDTPQTPLRDEAPPEPDTTASIDTMPQRVGSGTTEFELTARIKAQAAQSLARGPSFDGDPERAEPPKSVVATDEKPAVIALVTASGGAEAARETKAPSILVETPLEEPTPRPSPPFEYAALPPPTHVNEGLANPLAELRDIRVVAGPLPPLPRAAPRRRLTALQVQGAVKRHSFARHARAARAAPASQTPVSHTQPIPMPFGPANFTTTTAQPTELFAPVAPTKSARRRSGALSPKAPYSAYVEHNAPRNTMSTE